MSQHQEIAWTEIVGNFSSSFDEELCQRIVHTLSEVEKKSAQIMTIEDQLGTLKSSLASLYGVDFILRFFHWST
jgi:hypothetical protein